MVIAKCLRSPQQDGAETNFHSFTASWQACTSKGCPPTTRVLFTRPSGVMTTSILTLPATFIRFARSGYKGAVLVLTLRLDSSVEPDCANPEAPEKTSASVVATANFFHLLVLIDTTPQWIGRCPRKRRHVGCHGGE